MTIQFKWLILAPLWRNWTPFELRTEMAIINNIKGIANVGGVPCFVIIGGHEWVERFAKQLAMNKSR